MPEKFISSINVNGENYTIKDPHATGEGAIPGDGTISIQKNGTTIDSFSVNQNSDKTINIPVPVVDSSLSNSSANPVENQIINAALENKISIDGNVHLSGTFEPQTNGGANLGSANYKFDNLYVNSINGNSVSSGAIATESYVNTEVSELKTDIDSEYGVLYYDGADYSDKPWYPIATCIIRKTYTDTNLVLDIQRTFSNPTDAHATLVVHARTNDEITRVTGFKASFKELGPGLWNDSDLYFPYIMCTLKTGSDDEGDYATIQVWIKMRIRYDGYSYRRIIGNERKATDENNTTVWTISSFKGISGYSKYSDLGATSAIIPEYGTKINNKSGLTFEIDKNPEADDIDTIANETGMVYFQVDPSTVSPLFQIAGVYNIKVPLKDGTMALKGDIPSVDSDFSLTSTNPVQNKIIKQQLDFMQEAIDSKPGVKNATTKAEAFNGNSIENATGNYCHIEGSGTMASGDYAHAEGYRTKATYADAHAEGAFCEASGAASHAGGYYTLASSDHQTVIGKYNVEDTNHTYAFIIGNGSADGSRSDAFKVDWDGGIYLGNSNGKSGIIKAGNQNSDIIFTLPTTGGTLATTSDIPSVSNYVPLSGTISSSPITGKLEFNGNSSYLLFNTNNTGIRFIDSSSDTFSGVSWNGANFWLGARAGSQPTHAGKTFISTGWDTTNNEGYNTIAISIPRSKDGSTTATTRYVIHTGDNTFNAEDTLDEAKEIKLNNSSYSKDIRFRATNSHSDLWFGAFASSSDGGGIYNISGGGFVLKSVVSNGTLVNTFYGNATSSTTSDTITINDMTDTSNEKTYRVTQTPTSTGTGRNLYSNSGLQVVTLHDSYTRLLIGNSSETGTIRLYGSGSGYAALTFAGSSTNRAISLPDKAGIIALTSDIPTVTTYSAGTGLSLSDTTFSLSTPVSVANGGTGASSASSARTNLGLGNAATYGVTTSVTSGSSSLVTSGGVYSYCAPTSISITAASGFTVTNSSAHYFPALGIVMINLIMTVSTALPAASGTTAKNVATFSSYKPSFIMCGMGCENGTQNAFPAYATTAGNIQIVGYPAVAANKYIRISITYYYGR